MKAIDFIFTAFTYGIGIVAFLGITIGFVNVALGNVISF
jgi:hypothetical protein